MSETLALASGVIVTGFSGTQLDSALAATLRRVPFAGYILFARNLEDATQANALASALRAGVDPSPIVAIDQEGGRVMRLHRGVEAFPSMMALGATADAQLAFDAGEQFAHDLRRAGCTLDFAPVLDLALDARNTVIGTRAFGASPEFVSSIAGAFARGLEHGGIAATLKHFPGHGATALDTHLGAATLDVDEPTLCTRELVPFRACAPHASAIMAAHVAVPAIDGDRPASLSRRFLTEVLRERWHYDGVCFTDCMQMDAIARGVGTVRGVTEAIAAGADCAIVSHDPELALEAARHLARSVDAGQVPLARLQEAHARVLRLRMQASVPLEPAAQAPHPGIGRRIARAAVTLVRGVPHADPLADLAIVFGETSLAAHAPALRERLLALDPTEAECAAMLAELHASNLRPLVLAYRAHLHPQQALAIDAILARAPDALVVSSGEPYDLPLFAAAKHVLACYGNDEAAFAGLADVLFRGIFPGGVLPIAVE
jgi:beta-N-acetylhexosaminidase